MYILCYNIFMHVDFAPYSRQSAEFCNLGFFSRRKLVNRTAESFLTVGRVLEKSIELPRKVTIVFDRSQKPSSRNSAPAAAIAEEGTVRIMPTLYSAYAKRRQFIDGVTGHELSHISDYHTGIMQYESTVDRFITEGKAEHVACGVVGEEVLAQAGYFVSNVNPDIIDPILLRYDHKHRRVRKALQAAFGKPTQPAEPDYGLPRQIDRKLYVLGYHFVNHALEQTGLEILTLHPMSSDTIAQAAFEHLRETA